MGLSIKRRLKAATVAFAQNRAETLQERDDREMNERANESAKWLDEQIAKSPMGVWFPDDGHGANWIPSFFRAGRDTE